jgi:hypothetical protein
LHWCTENAFKNESFAFKVPVSVEENEDLRKNPFLLVSKASKEPNLLLSDLRLTGFNVSIIYCIHFKDELRETKITLSKVAANIEIDEIAEFENEVDKYRN